MYSEVSSFPILSPNDFKLNDFDAVKIRKKADVHIVSKLLTKLEIDI